MDSGISYPPPFFNLPLSIQSRVSTTSSALFPNQSRRRAACRTAQTAARSGMRKKWHRLNGDGRLPA